MYQCHETKKNLLFECKEGVWKYEINLKKYNYVTKPPKSIQRKKIHNYSGKKIGQTIL